jgi:hypothetical protein
MAISAFIPDYFDFPTLTVNLQKSSTLSSLRLQDISAMDFEGPIGGQAYQKAPRGPHRPSKSFLSIRHLVEGSFLKSRTLTYPDTH